MLATQLNTRITAASAPSSACSTMSSLTSSRSSCSQETICTAAYGGSGLNVRAVIDEVCDRNTL